MAGVKEALATLVECPICLEPFTDPRMLLVCLHSICYKCLDEYIKKTGHGRLFRCPVCRKDSDKPTNGAEAFPKNFFINNCTDLVRDVGAGARSRTTASGTARSNRKEASLCNLCEEELSHQFCLHCCEYYCKACSRAHKKSRASRSHEHVAIKDLTAEQLRAARLEAETPKCLKHDMKFDLYCSTCQATVCPTCFGVGHETHTIRELTDVDREMQTELSEATRSFQNLRADVRVQFDEIKRVQKTVDGTKSSALTTIHNVFQKTRQLLDKQERELKQKVSEATQDWRDQVGNQTKTLALDAELLDSMLIFTGDLLKSGTAFNRLACLPEVRTRLQHFQSSARDSTTHGKVVNSTDLAVQHLDGLVLKQGVKLGGGEGHVVDILVKYDINQQQKDEEARMLNNPAETLKPAIKTGKTVDVESRYLEKETSCQLKRELDVSRQVINRMKEEVRKMKQQVEQTTATTIPKQLRLTVYTYGEYSKSSLGMLHLAADNLPPGVLHGDVMQDTSGKLRPLTSSSPQRLVDVILCFSGDYMYRENLKSVSKQYKLDKETGDRNLVLIHQCYDGDLAETVDALGELSSLFQCVIHWNGKFDTGYWETAATALSTHLLSVYNDL